MLLLVARRSRGAIIHTSRRREESWPQLTHSSAPLLCRLECPRLLLLGGFANRARNESYAQTLRLGRCRFLFVTRSQLGRRTAAS